MCSVCRRRHDLERAGNRLQSHTYNAPAELMSMLGPARRAARLFNQGVDNGRIPAYVVLNQ